MNAGLVIAGSELIDEEDQATGARHQLLVWRTLDPFHGLLVDLPGQNTRLEQFVGRVEVQQVRRDDASQRRIQIRLNDLVNHAELVAQLAVGARLVEDAQGVFPEPPPNRKDRVVLGEMRHVVLTMPDAGVRQVPGHLAKVGLHDFLDLADSVRFLGENDLPNHCIHIGVGKLDANREPAFQLFEIGGARDCRLARADEEQFAANVLAAGFNDLLDLNGPLAVFPDVLLDFVEYDQGQRELTVLGQCLANSLQHVVAADVLNERVEVVERFHASGR